MFNIEITQEEFYNENDIKCIYGKITLGEFHEKFSMSLSFWKKDEYLRQWKKSLSEAIREGQSCLITSMVEPIKDNYIFCWPIYNEGDYLIFQNRILFLSDLSEEFKLENLNDYVGERTQYDEDGEKISEWKLKKEEVNTFLQSLS